MIRRPPISTRTDTLFPYTTLFRSWGQFWLAAVAAGLNFCNKTALSTEARLAGLIYSAVHLKRYCAQFGVPLPVEVRLLYDASKCGEISPINKLAPASD